MSFQSLVATVVLGLALSGCQSYDIVQSNIFSNDDGYAVRIDYGRSGSDHVNTFENPATGKETEFRSRLVVKVHLPDGDVFTAWQCMNFLRSGTMYKTDDGAWLVLVNGFTCMVYAADPTAQDPGRYREVYRGILCESPKSDYRPNPKWRKLKKDASGQWK